VINQLVESSSRSKTILQVLKHMRSKTVTPQSNSEAARSLVDNLIENGVDLRTEPSLEEMKDLFSRIISQ